MRLIGNGLLVSLSAPEWVEVRTALLAAGFTEKQQRYLQRKLGEEESVLYDGVVTIAQLQKGRGPQANVCVGRVLEPDYLRYCLNVTNAREVFQECINRRRLGKTVGIIELNPYRNKSE